MHSIRYHAKIKRLFLKTKGNAIDGWEIKRARGRIVHQSQSIFAFVISTQHFIFSGRSSECQSKSHSVDICCFNAGLIVYYFILLVKEALIHSKFSDNIFASFLDVPLVLTKN